MNDAESLTTENANRIAYVVGWCQAVGSDPMQASLLVVNESEKLVWSPLILQIL